MIIDLILDRQNGSYIDRANANRGKVQIVPYSPKMFYNDVMSYGEIGHGIATALDSGEEKDVKRELCAYVIGNEYNPTICEYIESVNWL